MMTISNRKHNRINSLLNSSTNKNDNLKTPSKNLLNSLTMASKITNESFNNDYKKLKEDDKYFFKMLNAYVKEGYRSMHENIKDILFPLRLLRKGGYRLFSYDERINKNIDLNMFKSKEQMTIFLNSVKEEFKQDELILEIGIFTSFDEKSSFFAVIPALIVAEKLFPLLELDPLPPLPPEAAETETPFFTISVT